MKRELKEFFENKTNIYVNVHKDKIIRDTEKSYCIDIGNNESIYIPKSSVLEKNKFFNYVRVYINMDLLYCLTTFEYSNEKWYQKGIDIVLKLIKSNLRENQFSKLYQEIKDIDSSIFWE